MQRAFCRTRITVCKERVECHPHTGQQVIQRGSFACTARGAAGTEYSYGTLLKGKLCMGSTSNRGLATSSWRLSIPRWVLRKLLVQWLPHVLICQPRYFQAQKRKPTIMTRKPFRILVMVAGFITARGFRNKRRENSIEPCSHLQSSLVFPTFS